jgi:hypothetical protein
VALVPLGPRPVAAQRWIAQLNGAAARIDDRPTKFFWGGRLGGAVNGRGSLLLDVGFGAAAGDFSVLDAGVEYRPLPDRTLGPFVRVGAGRLSKDYGGFLFLGAGGVMVRMTPRLYFRAGVILGAHGPTEGGAKGPVLYQGGLEVRF